MSYGVYASKEEFDIAMAGLHEDLRKLDALIEGASEKADILRAKEQGEHVGAVIEFVGGAVGLQEQIATIARVAYEAERVASMAELIPDTVLGEHKDLVHTLSKSVRMLSAFFRGMVEQLKDSSQ